MARCDARATRTHMPTIQAITDWLRSEAAQDVCAEAEDRDEAPNVALANAISRNWRSKTWTPA